MSFRIGSNSMIKLSRTVRGIAPRLMLAGIFLVALAVMFWSSSRYPTLGEKALMGDSMILEDPLSFDAVFPVVDSDPVWKQVMFSTVNWLSTNRQGMIFGVLMGAALLTLISYVKRRGFSGRFSNAFLGMAIGAPLGVCVNCAAPIAKGLHQSGMRVETTLAAMIASPTMNVVVLTMLFSLFPPFFAVTKVVLSVTVIVLVIPVLCHILPEGKQPEQENLPSFDTNSLEVLSSENWMDATKGFIRDYLANLWYIIKKTVPLMFLAGVLGALAVTLLPLKSFADISVSLPVVITVALFGLYLPVPIAFDIVICAVLLGHGMPVAYVMVLLFTLGIFSVYSFFIVGNSISWRTATVLSAVLVIIGVTAGYGTQALHKRQLDQALEYLSQSFDGVNFNPVSSVWAKDADKPWLHIERDDQKITIHRYAHRPRSLGGDKLFTKIEGYKIGVDSGVGFSIREFWAPFWEGRGISSGDLNNDGFADILVATDEGIQVFMNQGGLFKQRDLEIPGLTNLSIFNVAPIDLNNDGWLDIVVTSYRWGAYYILNKNGVFKPEQMHRLENGNAVVASAIAFADFHRDGDLDIVFGNWSVGFYKEQPSALAQNYLQFNENNGEFPAKGFVALPGMKGETLALLASDVNQDGYADLMVANDFDVPDIYYFSGEKGDLRETSREDNLIAQIPRTTMSIESFDLDNDLRFEIYLTQIAAPAGGLGDRLKFRPLGEYCKDLSRPADLAVCRQNIKTKSWYRYGSNFEPSDAFRCESFPLADEETCKALMLKSLAIRLKDKSICDHIKPDQTRAKFLCLNQFSPSDEPTAEQKERAIPQIRNRNILLRRRPDGTFEDKAEALGLDIAGWSWDVKVGDFDNDEWQDIYVLNGAWIRRKRSPSNVYFKNAGGKNFEESAEKHGLQDFMLAASGTRVDIDNDGDLDMLTTAVNGPVMAYINNDKSGNSITFEFRDRQGNHFGIGNKVIVHYGPNGERKQIRELKASGGYMSFDAPRLHFGLGEFQEISKLEIEWSTGEKMVLDEEFPVGANYVIERQKSAVAE